MPHLTLKPEYLSDALWTTCLEAYESELSSVREILAEIFGQTEPLRSQMEYATGSIGMPTAVALYLLTRWAKPTSVFEIGTFVGNSCLSIAKAMEVNGVGGEIATCDGSNSFQVPVELTTVPILGFGNTWSTEALQKVAANGSKIDLFHFDGRLAPEDYELVASLSHEKTIIALDDSDGIEKGVMNAMGLLSREYWEKSYVLISPPQGRNLQQMSPFTSRCLTSVLMPLKLLRFHATGFSKPVF